MANGRKTGGRSAGTPNKFSADLRAMILAALDGAGGEAYLQHQAIENPNAFLTLLGKVLPTTITGAGDGALKIQVVTGVPRWEEDEESPDCQATRHDR
jgi:hypothetical protein